MCNAVLCWVVSCFVWHQMFAPGNIDCAIFGQIVITWKWKIPIPRFLSLFHEAMLLQQCWLGYVGVEYSSFRQILGIFASYNIRMSVMSPLSVLTILEPLLDLILLCSMHSVGTLVVSPIPMLGTVHWSDKDWGNGIHLDLCGMNHPTIDRQNAWHHFI